MSRNNSDNNLAENYIVVNADIKDQPPSNNGSSIAPSDLEIISSFSGTSSSASSTSASAPTQFLTDIPRAMATPPYNQFSEIQPQQTSGADDLQLRQEVSQGPSTIGLTETDSDGLETTILEAAKSEMNSPNQANVKVVAESHVQTTTNVSNINEPGLQSNDESTTATGKEACSQQHHTNQQVTPVLPQSAPASGPQDTQNQSQHQQVAMSAALTRVRITDELNIFDWFRSSGLMNQIAEKTKNSMESVITVLDPGMKEYLFSGGNVNIIVISDRETMVAPVREAFQEVFGRATVSLATSPASSSGDAKTTPKRVATSFEQAITISLDKIKGIRADTNNVPQNQVILNIEPTLINCISQDFVGLVHDKSNIGLESDENSQLSKWFYVYSMILDDPVLGTFMNSFSQPIPVDMECVNKVQNSTNCASANSESKNPDNSGDSSSDKTFNNGPVDDIMLNRLNLNADKDDWIEQWTGISNHLILYNLTKSIAHLYKRKWQQYTESN